LDECFSFPACTQVYRRALWSAATLSVLKTKDRAKVGQRRASRVPFAAVTVKGLRFAPMNAGEHRALDRHPRCVCWPIMRRMSSSHVPRTCSEATTSLPRTEPNRPSISLLLASASADKRQQKSSLPQCETTAHPESERRADPVSSAYLPGSINPSANWCFAGAFNARCAGVGRAMSPRTGSDLSSEEGRSPVPGPGNILARREEWTRHR